VQIRRATSKKELALAFAVRTRVFVKEQGVPEAIELDRDDQRAIHFVARCFDKVVGTARLVIRHGSAKIGRMAVLKSFRRKGVGTKLLKRAVSTARTRGAKRIYLHAQVRVVGFYQRMNFRCVGPVFDEAGIPHRKMIFGVDKKATATPYPKRSRRIPK
jgi:predicted GNAT family N-acyltransferase